ncbi:carbon-nitrogen hydrolase [Diaporthe sp. PMI_573]|nr:carbon-nitrogen hydrolase [Diaporthaceae sp. PMI_573]
MRIACLQFAPQVGDVDNNLNRADSVLAKVDPDDLEGLDLLVLPELAFTGYKFDSLQHISPYLEHAGSGISSLWARTTALRLNTTVVVGYPEKVDVSPRWPTSPEYYNSSIVVDGEGQTIANYRKSFLYAIDETWALEGKDGFFHGDIPGLGRTAMGICMDLNPYRFEAPWHAFEFGFHIIEVQADLVIINMAWLTREEGRTFSRMLSEPDMETLTYWVQRLEPVIRAEGEHEIIVVFCNRTGFEDDAVYAGTSTVLGVADGEVSVYGILGRGVKDLLVVDTNDAPFAKLIQRAEGDNEKASVASSHRKPDNDSRRKQLRGGTSQSWFI